MKHITIPATLLFAALGISTALANGSGDSGLRAELQNPSLIGPGHNAYSIERGYAGEHMGSYSPYRTRGTWAAHPGYHRRLPSF
ncbi:hypothetical protein [Methylobacterium gnaphalii]|uniref:Uncharacterized protein n=1 Tax=Methylobacterium gnaphalii TaxID=1010610 RepID=A0A512JQ40_9HYPH|nr:hypothetical protein [Methylobacterium gnaphalii]GEP12080.1 hypothetical protein MGN01_39250 [Methylobacterium gnaphalii]GJD70729.1 hypothetical protein MMMDOFMJ_3682 [Methylobacterium gnaphalii]GLS48671.1 hypothetical protein GCM10007885_15150 [Methylobacterium gnaphalii]